jgi:aryl-alcohol dehydrogenase-like predicted oxidoreductase
MGVIAMKVCAQGALLQGGGVRGLLGQRGLTMDEALGYSLSLAGVSLAIVGCRTPAEVDDNARIARAFAPFDADGLQRLEQRTARQAAAGNYYKRPA